MVSEGLTRKPPSGLKVVFEFGKRSYHSAVVGLAAEHV